MEVLTAEYVISDIKDSRMIPRKETLLWVWHADKTPPHIGISTNIFYYSLKANGKDEGLSLDLIESIIEKKRIKTLVFALKMEVTVIDLDAVFSKFSKTIPSKITCLNPIKKIVGFNEVAKLSELLTVLESNDLISNVYGYNIDNQFDGLKSYTEQDIHSRLQKLSNE